MKAKQTIGRNIANARPDLREAIGHNER